MNKKYLGLLASAAAVCVPVMANADGAAAPAGPSLSDVLVNSGITAAGYVSASYNATFNSTDGSSVPGTVPLHAFDSSANSFELNQAALTLSYQPTSGFGGVVNVISGQDAKYINGVYSPGSASDFALTQAFVQYAVGNLTVIGGRFVTMAGEEVIDDSKNANISRSLLFQNLEPLVHTGIRATYKINDQFAATLGVNNSALGSASDVDKHKTVEGNVTFTPSSAITVALTDYYGVDGGSFGTSNVKTNFADLVASWQVTSALLLAANGDYVHSSTEGGSGSNGEGVALYGSYQVIDPIKVSLRGEYMRIKGGFFVQGIDEGIPGDGEGDFTAATQSDVAELTATVDYSAAKNFDVLGEVREDYATSLEFPSGNNTTFGAQKSQGEVLVKAIWKFGTPLPSS
jgi:hypothetical protein